MQVQDLLITFQHIHWQELIRNHHSRHYIWEISKILIPAMLTGLITFIAMRIADNRNKKRWLNDGHLKRKTELEIEIRKFLLGIKANMSMKYEVLADWYEEQDDVDPELIYGFNKDFEALFKYLQKEEGESDSTSYYKQIFALFDEYECYVPKISSLFYEFKALYNRIFELKTICENEDSHAQSTIIQSNILEEIKKKPERFDDMINTYLCFQVAIEKILDKLIIKKLK